ncbi:unnamed protein product [Rhodiola kirilowii]
MKYGTRWLQVSFALKLGHPMEWLTFWPLDIFLVSITCTQVISDLRPCFSYLQSGSGKPPSACCAGASTLAEAAATSADRRAACECIKTASQALKPNPDLAADLPKNCGIDLPFAISATLDCSKY